MLSASIYNYFDWANLKHEWLAVGPKWNGTISEQAFYPYGGDFALNRNKLWNDIQPPSGQGMNDPGNLRFPKNYNRHSTVELYISADSTFTLEAKKTQYTDDKLGSLWVPQGGTSIPGRSISEAAQRIGLNGTLIENQALVDILSTKNPTHWIWLTNEEMEAAGVKGMPRRNYIQVGNQYWMHRVENFWPEFGGPHPDVEESQEGDFLGAFHRPIEDQYVGVSLSSPSNQFTVHPETVYWYEKYYDQRVTINVRDHVPAGVTHVMLRINGYVYDGRNVNMNRNYPGVTGQLEPQGHQNYHEVANLNIVKFIHDNPSLKQYRLLQGGDMKEQVNERCCDVDIDAKCCLASQDKPLALPSIQQSYSCGAADKGDAHIYYISYADFPGDTTCPILKHMGIKTHIILADLLRDLQKLVIQGELVSDDYLEEAGPFPDSLDFYLGEGRADTGRKGSDMGDQPQWSDLERFKDPAPYGWMAGQLKGVYFPYLLAHHAVQRAQAEQATKDVMAKAMFFRGYFGLELQKNFEFPPIVDRPVVEADFVALTFTNPNELKIWDSVITDLTYAATHLEDVHVHDGISKMAAHAYLAKAIMYTGDASKMKDAIPVLEPVVNSGLFHLTPKYEDNFLSATTFNSESIFEIKYWRNSFGVTLMQPYTTPWGCCGFGHATQDAVDVFQTDASGLPKLDGSWKQHPFTDSATGEVLPGNEMMPIDPRLDHTLSRPGVLFKDWFPYSVGFVRSLADMGPYRVKKQEMERDAFQSLPFGVWASPSSNNVRKVRLAHVMLWLAEAYVEDDQLEKARALVNQLRQRANNTEGWVRKAELKPRPPDASWMYVPEFDYVEGYAHDNYKVGVYTSPWTDKAAAREAVRMETRLETSLEGNRWYDLQRWGTLADTINDYLQRETLPQYDNVTFTEDYEYLNLDKFYAVNPELTLTAPVVTQTDPIDPADIVGTWKVSNWYYGITYPDGTSASTSKSFESLSNERPCYMDDLYTFHEDGSYSMDLGAETWVELPMRLGPDGTPREGVLADITTEQCGSPVAPWLSSTQANYTMAAVDEQFSLTLKGKTEADYPYIGLWKLGNFDGTGYSREKTYDILMLNDQNLRIRINTDDPDMPKGQFDGATGTDTYLPLGATLRWYILFERVQSPSRRHLSVKPNVRGSVASESGLHNVDPFDPLPAKLFNRPLQKK